MSKEKNFVRVCLSLDKDTIASLDSLAKSHRMSKSEFIKYVILRYENTYGFTTPWLRGKA